MSYKELLEKYKAGTATPEEIETVERELEKYESVNEYLAEDLAPTLPVTDAPGYADAASSRQVRRSILKKFVLTAALSVAAVAAAVLAVFYVVSPLMDRNAYQPLQSRSAEQYGETKLLIDTAVYTELHFPGVITNWTVAEPLGFGRYDVELMQWDVFKGTEERYSCRIEGKRVKNLSRGFYQFPAVNTFRHGVYPFTGFNERGDAQAIEEIKKLPETARIQAFASFREDVPFSSLYDIRARFKGLYFGWIAVRSCEKDRQQLPQIGFEPTGSGIIIEREAVDQAKYPNLELAWLDEGAKDASAVETHFKSLLKYMADNRDFLDLLDVGDIYTDTLAYVEKNGVKSYGVMVIGSGKDVLALRELPEVDSLTLENVKISSYSK